ncbi:MAG: group II intron reverse transcriptase/maturase, partial [Hyphomicrobiales bacterium]|nr:group II intron reverse transcriptase/maturase [Hyphomicrobiales bacterium]
MKQERVLERIYNMGRLRQAWQQVRRNAGAAGVDEMSVEEFGEVATEWLQLIQMKLKTGSYKFMPARRVYIPKPGSSRKRGLG